MWDTHPYTQIKLKENDVDRQVDVTYGFQILKEFHLCLITTTKLDIPKVN